MTNEHFQCIIIGAGPAGISLGYHLKMLGIQFIIFDQGSIGQSWISMPEKLRLLSPFWTNRLPGFSPGLFRLFSKPGKQEYLQYLKEFVSHEHIPVMESTRVTHVYRQDEQIHVETSNGHYFANTAVCASGYFHNPYMPVVAGGNDQSVPSMHAAEYMNAAGILRDHPKCGSVLVVGKRVTAGQLISELHDAGIRVMLSARGEVETRGYSLRHLLKEHLYFFYESIKTRLQPHLKMNSYPTMDGGQTTRLLRSGAVTVFGEMESIRNGHVYFIDGELVKPDLIIYATGYRPFLDYVSDIALDQDSGIPVTRNMQSINVPGIYFLGFDNIINFRSRYLRGIRNDSKKLATTIQQALAPS